MHGATVSRVKRSDLECAVLNIQRRRLPSSADGKLRARDEYAGIGRGDPEPGRRRHHRRRNHQRWRVIGGCRCGMAVLVAAALIGRVRFMTRRRVIRCLRHHRVELRTYVRRHRHLLKQQAQEREERNPAMAAAVEVHGYWPFERDRVT